MLFNQTDVSNQIQSGTSNKQQTAPHTSQVIVNFKEAQFTDISLEHSKATRRCARSAALQNSAKGIWQQTKK